MNPEYLIDAEPSVLKGPITDAWFRREVRKAHQRDMADPFFSQNASNANGLDIAAQAEPGTFIIVLTGDNKCFGYCCIERNDPFFTLDIKNIYAFGDRRRRNSSQRLENYVSSFSILLYFSSILTKNLYKSLG